MNIKLAPKIVHLTSFFLLFVSSTTFAGSENRAGIFSGLSSHETTGSVSVVKEGDSYVIVLGEDFMLDGAPDPRVGMGKNGQYDPTTLIDVLHSNTGKQRYVVPAGIDVVAFNEVYIWCEKFSVGLGVAPIK